MTTIPKTRFLSREEASAYLRDGWGISRTIKTLAKLATLGGGPPYRRDSSRCLYDARDLDQWAQSILSPKVNSSAELSTMKHTTGNGRGWSWKE